VRKNPANFQAAFDLASAYLQMQQTDRALQVLDGVLNYPQADASALRGLVQAYASFGNQPGLQKTVDKLEARCGPIPPIPRRQLALRKGTAICRNRRQRCGRWTRLLVTRSSMPTLC